MEDIGIRLVTNDEQFTSGADKVISKINEIDKAAEKTNKKLTEGMTEAVDAQDKFQEETAGTVTALKDVTKEQEAANKSLIDGIKNYKVFGVSINDVTGKLKAFTAGSKLATAAVGGGTKALRLFKVALISTGIGAIVVALGSLIAYFTRTQKGIDAVSRVMSGLGAVVSVFIDRLSSLGSTIINAVANPLETLKSVGAGVLNALKDPLGAIKGLATGTVDAIKSVSKEVANEFDAAKNLEAQSQRLRESERALTVETAKRRAEIKRLNEVTKDITKSDKERTDAAEEAIAIEQELLDKRIKNGEERVRIIKQQNALGESLVEDLDRQAEAEVALYNLQEQSAQLQARLRTELNTINAQSVRKVQELRKAYSDLYDDLQTQLFDLEVEEADPVTRLQLQQAKSLELLEEQKIKLVELASLTGGDIDKVVAGYDKLIQAVKEKTDEEINKLKNERLIDPVEIIGLPNKVEYSPQIDVGEITVSKTFEEKIQEFKQSLLDAFGISEEEGRILLDGVNNVLDKVYENHVANIDRKIEENEKYRNDLQNDIDALEDKYERDKELDELGAASDVDTLSKQIEDKKQLQAQADKEAQELQKKRAKAELVQNIATQISNLTTAAAKVFSATSGIPFIGIPLALGFIASMYGAFKAFKSQAKADIKLYSGAERVGDYFGYVKRGHESDIPGRGRGHRIEGTNVVLGGNEMVSTEEAARVQGELFMDVNKNPKKYEGVDVLGILEDYKAAAAGVNNVGRQAMKITKKVFRSERKAKDKAIEKAIEANGEMIVKAIKDKAEYLQLNGKIYEVKNGKRVRRPI